MTITVDENVFTFETQGKAANAARHFRMVALQSPDGTFVVVASKQLPRYVARKYKVVLDGRRT